MKNTCFDPQTAAKWHFSQVLITHCTLEFKLSFFNSSGPTCSLMSGGTLLAEVCAPNTWKWRPSHSRGRQRIWDQSQSTSCIRNVSENQCDQWSLVESKITSAIRRKHLVSLFCFHTEYMISSSVGHWISASTGPHMASLSLAGRLSQMTREIITQSALLLKQWAGEPWVPLW